jgi:hypothetical protein
VDAVGAVEAAQLLAAVATNSEVDRLIVAVGTNPGRTPPIEMASLDFLPTLVTAIKKMSQFCSHHERQFDLLCFLV